MAIWINEEKSGTAWVYDFSGITYDGDIDPLTNQVVYYDGIGTVTSFTNQSKS